MPWSTQRFELADVDRLLHLDDADCAEDSDILYAPDEGGSGDMTANDGLYVGDAARHILLLEQ